MFLVGLKSLSNPRISKIKFAKFWIIIYVLFLNYPLLTKLALPGIGRYNRPLRLCKKNCYGNLFGQGLTNFTHGQDDRGNGVNDLSQKNVHSSGRLHQSYSFSVKGSYSRSNRNPSVQTSPFNRWSLHGKLLEPDY